MNIDEQLENLGYTVTAHFKTFLSDAVVKVEDKNGEEWVVKSSRDHEALYHEYQIMDAFSSQDVAPRVTMLSPSLMKMQDMGSIELRDDPDPDHLKQVAHMMINAHKAPMIMSAPDLISSLKIRDHHTMMQSRDIDAKLLAMAEKSFERMECDHLEQVLLHADLHLKNIMLTLDGPKMIDPYGRLGPAIYDVVMVACGWPNNNWDVYQKLLQLYPQPDCDTEAWFIWNAVKRLDIAYVHDFPLDRHLAMTEFCLQNFK